MEGLQCSSFIFTVPKNRPLSGPMIWQEWHLASQVGFDVGFGGSDGEGAS